MSEKVKTFQDNINNVVLEKLPISMFKVDSQITLKANTYGIKCRKCHSENINVKSCQTRAADEGDTKVYTCLDCGHVWMK